MNQKPFDKNDPMYRVTYWVVIVLSVLVFLIGAGVWALWLLTKVVLG